MTFERLGVVYMKICPKAGKYSLYGKTAGVIVAITEEVGMISIHPYSSTSLIQAVQYL